jgi:peptidoglycan/LPS O-acetylase OafA/YrhL
MKHGLDVSRLAIGAGVTALLSVGLAAALLRHAYHTPNEGPTSATLEEAYNAFYGAGLGLALGGAFTAALARRGPRIPTGIAAGLLAYVVVLAPILIFFGDTSPGENIGFAAVLVLPAATFTAIGALLGTAGATFRHKRSRTK